MKNYSLCGLVIALAAAAGTPLTAPLIAKDAAAARAGDQAKIRKNAQATLTKLYGLNLKSKGAIQSAAGYAVFSNFGMKFLLAGGGSGNGLAVNNKSKREIFMKMVEIQAGLGFGAKRFELVWVFETDKALDQFIDSGWELGGQATAAAKLGDAGGSYQGAIPIAPEVWLYQMTDNGLALELTAKGTKYYKDQNLNQE